MRHSSTKKDVTVTIKTPWLLYDIMNETYLRGRTLQNKENYKEAANMYASMDEGHRDKILRAVKSAFAEVKTGLEEYLDESMDSTDNICLDGSGDLALNLKMPGNFNEAATDGIGEGVHAYIVNSAIAYWYMVTNKAEADQYFALATKSMESIRHAASKRIRPTYPTETKPDQP